MDRRFIRTVSLKREKVRDFSQYPFCIPAVGRLEELDFNPAVTFFIGENGSGKSTLIEAIAVAMGFNAEGGSKNFRFATRASHSELHEFLKVVKGIGHPRDGYFLRAESFYNVASEIERLGAERSYGGRSLHRQSHGEAFLALITNRFGGGGLYILDEPEAALSPQRQLACLGLIHGLARRGAQFIIATHSPILMALPGATLYAFSEEGIAPTEYEETEHYQISKMFFERRESLLKDLLDDE